MFKCELKRNGKKAINSKNFCAHVISPQYHVNDQDIEGEMVCDGKS